MASIRKKPLPKIRETKETDKDALDAMVRKLEFGAEYIGDLIHMFKNVSNPIDRDDMKRVLVEQSKAEVEKVKGTATAQKKVVKNPSAEKLPEPDEE